MKTTTLFLVLSLSSLSVFSKIRIPIPYGTEEKIIKIHDLPDVADFRLKDGRYFDLGSKYSKNHILWLPYSNTTPEIVGFIQGDENTFLELSAEDLIKIEKIAGVTIPKKGKVSFFDKFVGKGLLGLLGLLVLFGIYDRFFGKEEA
ncbi:hypothetical protein [Tenacibaculum maritimum]|uniref:Uncharacterized protein n=2 Tax=Tenacibaculum maritimum TaxID=107401 RepID=A0A2H1E8K2_9FLAO|nr:hypothetical protein [Tenacibaculum maritimum]MCD9564215.1 hypothetical protein [Tenacibaculum maritimum]MCD9567068.1 hypothetical protein [Tenacibaculum maritimum]MCD9580280.1 hypothetical protein [Tenacibaculum maritimum]MCD9583027.1 hypothetical protein [Tenacibaculum maritimum]MCD9585854.1 hypothetical protein [Tenacibaculum maritimum]